MVYCTFFLCDLPTIRERGSVLHCPPAAGDFVELVCLTEVAGGKGNSAKKIE